MKSMIVVAFLAMVAVAFAQPEAGAASPPTEKAVEPVKAEDVKDARDKRGLLVTSYATAPISAPVAYTSYAAPVAYPYAVHQYPSAYVASYPYSPLTYTL